MVVEDLTISSTVPRYLIRGLNLRVNCSATLGLSAMYDLKWHPPRGKTFENVNKHSTFLKLIYKYFYGKSPLTYSFQDSRVFEKDYLVQLGNNSFRHFKELNIISLKDEDSGTYKCSIRTDTDLKEAQTDIEIHG